VPLKTCTVVIHDLNETAHTLDVTAATLYEAVAQAFAAARAHDRVGGFRYANWRKASTRLSPGAGPGNLIIFLREEY